MSRGAAEFSCALGRLKSRAGMRAISGVLTNYLAHGDRGLLL